MSTVGVQECVVHFPHSFDTDCESCDVEMKQRYETLEEMRRKVSNAGAVLHGFGVKIPAAVIMEQRMDMLMDALLGPRARVEFEVKAGEHLLHVLEEQNAVLARQTISGPPKALTVVTGNGGLSGLKA